MTATLTDEEFRLFRNLIYDESGMFLRDSKKDFLENRLTRRMRAVNASSPYWYYRFVTAERKAELLVLLDNLTINETSFFRNEPQFEFFKKTILPELMRQSKRRGDRRLRIWSAGCSTGEEPYSIAMAVLESIPDAGCWDIKIHASDLSLTALETAHRGVYSAEKTGETVPGELRARYFTAAENGYRVSDDVRKLVVFDYHNLKHESAYRGLDVVFCRNVMIYFDEEEQKRLARRFERCLNPGGWFLLGHAETLHGWGLDFQFVCDHKGTGYRKPDKEEHL